MTYTLNTILEVIEEEMRDTSTDERGRYALAKLRQKFAEIESKLNSHYKGNDNNATNVNE